MDTRDFYTLYRNLILCLEPDDCGARQILQAVLRQAHSLAPHDPVKRGKEEIENKNVL